MKFGFSASFILYLLHAPIRTVDSTNTRGMRLPAFQTMCVLHPEFGSLVKNPKYCQVYGSVGCTKKCVAVYLVPAAGMAPHVYFALSRGLTALLNLRKYNKDTAVEE